MGNGTLNLLMGNHEPHSPQAKLEVPLVPYNQYKERVLESYLTYSILDKNEKRTITITFKSTLCKRNVFCIQEYHFQLVHTCQDKSICICTKSHQLSHLQFNICTIYAKIDTI